MRNLPACLCCFSDLGVGRTSFLLCLKLCRMVRTILLPSTKWALLDLLLEIGDWGGSSAWAFAFGFAFPFTAVLITAAGFFMEDFFCWGFALLFGWTFSSNANAKVSNSLESKSKLLLASCLLKVGLECSVESSMDRLLLANPLFITGLGDSWGGSYKTRAFSFTTASTFFLGLSLGSSSKALKKLVVSNPNICVPGLSLLPELGFFLVIGLLGCFKIGSGGASSVSAFGFVVFSSFNCLNWAAATLTSHPCDP